jgi:hypothetical protein
MDRVEIRSSDPHTPVTCFVLFLLLKVFLLRVKGIGLPRLHEISGTLSSLDPTQQIGRALPRNCDGKKKPRENRIERKTMLESPDGIYIYTHTHTHTPNSKAHFRHQFFLNQRPRALDLWEACIHAAPDDRYACMHACMYMGL